MENVITRQAVNDRTLGLSKLLLIALLFFFEVLIFQWVNNAFFSEYTGYPDEAAHYVSSLLIENYITNGEIEHPLYFAEDYYYHYPKVAIGHWPPVMYGLLALWFIVFGASRISTMCFVAATTAALATTIYYIAKNHLNKFSAVCAPLLFIAIPLIQTMSAVLMLELMVTLFILIACTFLAKFLSTGKTSDGIYFALLASAAILTRGTAWSIGLMPIMIMLMAWRFEMLKKPILWISGGLVLTLCLPWYLSMPSVDAGAFEGGSIYSSNFTLEAISWFAKNIYVEIGLVILLLTGIGIWSKIIYPILSKQQLELIWPTLLSIMLAIYFMHVIIPADFSIRYMTTIVPSIVLFSFAGIEWLISKISFKNASPILIGGLSALYVISNVGIDLENINNDGYVLAHDLAAGEINSRNKSILIASDVFGEGSVIARAAELDKDKQNVILRGSKLLVSEDWVGRNPVSKFTSTHEVARVLANIPVDAVILDNTMTEDRYREYHLQLEYLLKNDTENWQLLHNLPATKRGKVYQEGILVYKSLNPTEEKIINTPLIKELYQNNRIPSLSMTEK